MRPLLRLPFAGLLLLLLLALAGASAGAQESKQVPASRTAIQLSFAPLVRQVAPAVVNVTSRKPATDDGNPFSNDPFFQFFFRDFGGGGDPAPRQRVEQSLGSGVIVRADGLIVTNHHVVAGAEEIEVVLSDRRSFEARLLSSDERTDLAFLQIDAGGAALPSIELGNSDAIEVGDLALAIGNPFGLGQTVTSGIVSATGRTAPQLDRDISFIQTDASINPGNSGGALIGLDGRLIGINTAIFTRSGGSVGIGFAIPANLVRVRMQGLDAAAAGSEIARPWLGAEMQAVSWKVAQSMGLDRPQGVVLTRIHPAGAAARAGLAKGDVVTRVAGAAVDDPAALNYRLTLHAIGDEVQVVFLRKGKLGTVALEVEAAPQQPTSDVSALRGGPLAGATVANLSPAFNEQLGIDMFRTGIVVLNVQQGSRAARLRLRPGDTLTSVNDRPVVDVAELQRQLGRPLQQLAVRRDEREFVLRLDP